jgi:hypothetical protein
MNLKCARSWLAFSVSVALGLFLFPSMASGIPGSSPGGEGATSAFSPDVSGTTYLGEGRFPRLVATLVVLQIIIPPDPHPMSTANTEVTAPACSAGTNSIGMGATCSATTGRPSHCSAHGGSSGNGYSCSASNTGIGGSDGFCSASGSGSGSCSVQGGDQNSHCSAGSGPSGTTGNMATCSSTGGGVCSVADGAGGGSGSSNNSCSSYNQGGEGSTFCSASGSTSKCSVGVASGNATCTAYFGAPGSSCSAQDAGMCSTFSGGGLVSGPGEDGLCHAEE